MVDVNDKVRQVFNYLLDVKNLTSKVVRNVGEYETVWLEKDINNSKGCFFEGTGNDSDAWLEIHKQSLSQKNIQNIYSKLFALYQSLQREGENLELVWGHGLLSWHTKDEEIKRPLIVTPLELVFDPKKGIFSLLPTSKGSHIEIDMLSNIDIHDANSLQSMVRDFETMNIEILQEESLAPLLKEIIKTVDLEGQYVEDEKEIKKASKAPFISYSSMIMIRKKDERIWIRELENIINLVDKGKSVPIPIKAFVSEEKFEDSSQAEWEEVGKELLFPLAINNEQRLIAKKIAENNGIVVQGPPGTGKSHTIANLICHLLAHGKRVLVTSEKERALKVLRDMLPPEIRNLCVSLLGGDSKSLKELEESIKLIAEGLDSKQPEILEANSERLRTELIEVRKRISRTKLLIDKAAEADNQKIKLNDNLYTPLELAKWLKDNEKHNWMPDSFEINQHSPLSDEEIKEFINLLNNLNKADLGSLSKKRIKVADLPKPTIFDQHTRYSSKLENEVDGAKNNVADFSLPKGFPENEKVEKWLLEMTDVVEELRSLQESFSIGILKEVFKDETRESFWNDFINESTERIRIIKILGEKYIETEITMKEDINPVLAKEDIEVIGERLKNKQNIGWLYLNTTGKKYKYLFEDFLINGVPIRSFKDTELLLDYLELKDLKKRFVLKWNNTLGKYEDVELNPTMSQFEYTVESILGEIKKALDFRKETIDKFKVIIEELGFKKKPQWTSLNWYSSFKDSLEALLLNNRFDSAKTFFVDLSDMLMIGKDSVESHSTWDGLYDATKTLNSVKYKENYLELGRLENIEAEYEKYIEYKEKLEKVAPKWVQELHKFHEENGFVFYAEDWKLAWIYSQGNKLLKDHQEMIKKSDLENNLKIALNTEARIIVDLVSESTWLEQIKRTTSAQRRSLFAWQKAVKRIGKGTGKYASFYRKEASSEMSLCRGAIPVWVMPIQKVIENFELNEDLFDVVIIDESSQSNLFALVALMRGKKVVIVGDDNQISPETVGVDFGEVHKLIERDLQGIPQRKRFEMTTSLYDLACQVFESKVVLKEHFRCVPEIIEFSNNFMYGGSLKSLRLPLPHEILTPPVEAIKVSEGVREENTAKTLNVPEAKRIVTDICKCLKDNKYKDKTFGVISLQGHDQAKLIEELLGEVLTEEEIINRKLISGDPYSFQGDERDVIFLSMVAAKNKPIGPMTRNTYYQRFNVAASRARDQMFLYHSVDLDDLNPECARFHLLEYCLNPFKIQTEVNNPKKQLESQLEADVYKYITKQGYKVIPQVKVGSVGKRLDMVIEGERNRLAIECDGDKWYGPEKWHEDMERQRVLERVGWTFFRVRGSSFYYNPQKVMNMLLAELSEMGIKPVDAEKKIV